MCTAALKQELNQRIDRLPDDSVKLLIQFIDSISSVNAGKSETGQSENPRTYRKPGALKGNLVLADDFDETPECFKEYA